MDGSDTDARASISEAGDMKNQYGDARALLSPAHRSVALAPVVSAADGPSTAQRKHARVSFGPASTEPVTPKCGQRLGSFSHEASELRGCSTQVDPSLPKARADGRMPPPGDTSVSALPSRCSAGYIAATETGISSKEAVGSALRASQRTRDRNSRRSGGARLRESHEETVVDVADESQVRASRVRI